MTPSWLRTRNSRHAARLQEAIVAGLAQGLQDMGLKHSADIRERVKKSFDELEQRVDGSIDEEIAVIAASLRAVIDKKKAHEFSADQERKRLTAARAAVTAAAASAQARAAIAVGEDRFLPSVPPE